MFLGSRARPVRRADNLTAICEPTVYTTRDPQHLTTLLASTACYWDFFISQFILQAALIHLAECFEKRIYY
jgi:hypothetical protein